VAQTANQIVGRLGERLALEHQDAAIALTFRSPLELLVSVMLSAQTTDVNVNRVTEKLFVKYKRPEDYLAVPVAELERDIFATGFYRQKAKSLRGTMRLLIEEFDGEVPSTLDAARKLADEGTSVRVVSMPCMDRFELAPAAERERVLGPPGTRRIAVEAASPFGWDRWIGERGAMIGMRSFGASGPQAAVYEHFGITRAAIVEKAHELLST